MDNFFASIYYYTNGLYSQELDNYLFDIVPGYLHVGLAMVVISVLFTIVFYYTLKPVRKQWLIWFLCLGLNSLINLILAVWYSYTPIINNEIDASVAWTLTDCFGFGIANIIWSIATVLVASLLIKWWSPAKYIPFKKF
nr:hypothetical protein [uncultured Porphyromonas sp.]